MKTNNYYETKKIILYNDNLEMTREINPYQAKAFYNTQNIFNEQVETNTDYFNINIKDLIIVKNNISHIESKKKKKMIFFVCEAGTIQGVLYIPFELVKTHEVLEEKQDFKNRGCVSVSYNDKIIFNDSFIKIDVKDSMSYFAKPTDPCNDNFHEEIKGLEDEIEDLKERLYIFPKYAEHKKRVIALYESKLKDGYKYIVFRYRCIDKNANYIILYNCVDHYEKSNEYLKLEKLTKELKKYCDRWTEDDTVALLKDYKLTKIRK